MTAGDLWIVAKAARSDPRDGKPHIPRLTAAANPAQTQQTKVSVQ